MQPRGELRIRGRRAVSMFLDYLDDDAAKRDALDAKGHVRTGDRVVVQDDGAISFVERTEDSAKVGGEHVSALKVERVVIAEMLRVSFANISKPKLEALLA